MALKTKSHCPENTSSGLLKLVDEVVAIQVFYRVPVFALPITGELYIVVGYSIDRFLANYSINQIFLCVRVPVLKWCVVTIHQRIVKRYFLC